MNTNLVLDLELVKNSYPDYRKNVFDWMNINSTSVNFCINNNLVVERKFNANGQPYRLMTEDEYYKFNLK
jgi:hypothetical protein